MGAGRRILLHSTGIVAAVGLGVTVWLGLWVTPPDAVMGNLVRLVYIHPGVAWCAFMAFGVSALASALYLWPRTRDMRWDRLAGASAEVGVVFTALTLVSGSLWGRPTWGVYWTWDPLLTTTAVLFLLYLGYLTLRKATSDPSVRARRCSVAALVAVVDVPIVHFSVLWWRSLHQPPTVLNPTLTPEIHGEMAWVLLLGFCSMLASYVWLTAMRYRNAALEEVREQAWLKRALAERIADVPDPLSAGRMETDPLSVAR
jgi:heme exporter protein C